MSLVRSGVRPRDIITRTALENAIASVAATGGSTNAVLHLIAIAREAGAGARARRLRSHQRATPLLRDLKPAGRFVATDLHAGRRQPRWSRKRLLEASADRRRGADGHRPHARRRKRRDAVETPGQEVVRPLGQPLKTTGGLVILRGNLAPEGCGGEGRGHRAHDASRSGARVRQRGSGVRRGAAPDDQGRRRRRHPLRGAERRAGHARDARRHRRDRRRGPRRDGGAVTDGRFSGATRGFMVGHVAPEALARRPDRRRPRRRHDRRSTSTTREARPRDSGARRSQQRLAAWTARRRATRPACSRNTRSSCRRRRRERSRVRRKSDPQSYDRSDDL